MGVAVGTDLGAVVTVVGIQALGGLPLVGHAVAVGVGRGCQTVEHWPCTPVGCSVCGLVVFL